MTAVPELAHGSWPSPITTELVTRAAAGIAETRVDGDDVWWAESRPDEGGRTQLVRRDAAGTTHEVLPEGWSARTRVHEYGGGAWWVRSGTVWFASWADQRLHVVEPGAAPRPITPEPPAPAAWRYADGVVTPDGRWIVCVRERHDLGEGPAEVVNELVAVPADGSAPPVAFTGDGHDFVAAPRISPDGQRLCWLTWDHPRMPWDGTELWVADLDLDHGDGPRLASARPVAGGPDESLVQPDWTADGELLVVSDRSDWWNLHRVVGLDGDAPDLEAIAPTDAEIGTPPWVFAMSRWARLDDGRFVVAVSHQGLDHLAVIEPGVDHIDELATPYTSISSVRAAGDAVVAVVASATSEPAVVRIRPVDGDPDVEVLRSPRDLGLDPAWISHPHPVTFPTSGGRHAHALFYPPTNPDVGGPEGAKPPLLVMIHGGPTAAARSQLNLAVQYWTSRGIAVADVNYGGSTGFGRRYRRQLDGQWGVVDVDDCEAAARHLAAAGLADPDRLLIRGGSAGGFTTLAALAFRDTFAAGASHYGVADLAALAQETHKFESRYLDGLVGPWPAARDVYRARSPIHHVEQIDRPLIVFQGLDDEIVPPNQSEMIVEAVRANGVPVAYVPFEGEQHGFRQAPNIRRALEAELWFYGRVLGFTPADEIEPVEVLEP
ncbi:MAG TPA: prolyl oligopeptidase family serine peptidase [Acidimicrobiales bacterium]|nr:prolyl oligopeptidase family serine peptidase [Acidimicrobiales bacterium]